MHSQAEMDAIIRGDDAMEHKFEPFEKVLVKETKHSPWEAHIFSRIAKNLDETASYKCLGGSSYSYCIHYAGNEHLLGTTEAPEPKHEYKWGDKVEVFLYGSAWIKGLYCAKEDGGTHKVYVEEVALTAIENNCIRPLKEDKWRAL